MKEQKLISSSGNIVFRFAIIFRFGNFIYRADYAASHNEHNPIFEEANLLICVMCAHIFFADLFFN